MKEAKGYTSILNSESPNIEDFNIIVKSLKDQLNKFESLLKEKERVYKSIPRYTQEQTNLLIGEASKIKEIAKIMNRKPSCILNKILILIKKDIKEIKIPEKIKIKKDKNKDLLDRIFGKKYYQNCHEIKDEKEKREFIYEWVKDNFGMKTHHLSEELNVSKVIINHIKEKIRYENMFFSEKEIQYIIDNCKESSVSEIKKVIKKPWYAINRKIREIKKYKIKNLKDYNIMKTNKLI